MATKLLLNDLLYINEHLTCRNYLSTIDVGFKYIELGEDTFFSEEDAKRNYLLFFLEGVFTINCNGYIDRKFRKGEMVLLPRSSFIKGTGVQNSKMVALLFDMPESSCDKLVLQSLSEVCEDVNYNFNSVPIRYPITSFLEMLVYCLKNGMNCFHLHEIKQREIFLLLRGFYSREELALLFYPIIGKELDFRNFVLQNFRKVENVQDLIAMSNMGRTTFFNKFKTEFGVSVKQWMLKHTNERLLDKASEPGVTIKTLMSEFGFETQAHLTHYCQQQFGCTPKKIIERSQSENQ